MSTVNNALPASALLKWNELYCRVEIVGKGNKGFRILLDKKRLWVAPIFLSEFKM